MGADTRIEWCHDTWSPWYGCIKVSAGCLNCYADAGSDRNPAVFGIWGPPGIGTRRVAADSAWVKALAWERGAAARGERRRVFPSLCDPFEDWTGAMIDAQGQPLWRHDPLAPWGPAYIAPPDATPVTMRDARRRFADLILRTPHLDWLLLTKRPENAGRMLVEMFGPGRDEWPRNFRVGTSVEDQASADARMPHLMRLDWPNFVSYEPALGSVDFARIVENPIGFTLITHNAFHRKDSLNRGKPWRGIDWIIAGGESGPDARPMHPGWARSVRDQCAAAGVPFLFKQWGEWAPVGPVSGLTLEQDRGERHWFKHDGGVIVSRVGKKLAGRSLDGVIHDGFPDFEGVSRG